ncbi:MAG: DUF928 domain-containing protein [Oscillatoria sp. SIO1A7]|nr:DUF928 domain-containing protein [Oscillatoria sp. SIO1A7]
MKGKKSIASMKKLAAMLAPALVLLSGLSAQRARGLDFNTPGSDIGQPGTSIGGGTRNLEICKIPEGEELKALMPSQNLGAVGRTVSKAPALYWYLPENTATLGEVVVVDEERNEVYFAEFTLPSKSGIIKYEIPASAGLEEGKQYEWQMALVCDTNDRTQDEFVRGNLLVVAQTTGLEDDLAAAANNALEKASAYNKAQIWHDTVSSLAPAAEQYPEEWARLLESVGLPEEIATATVVDCCTAEN